MSNFEVPSPILNSPFEEPKEHWWILEGQPAEHRQGRRPAIYFYREPRQEADQRGGLAIEMKLVNRIRERVKAWRDAAGGHQPCRSCHQVLDQDRERRRFGNSRTARTPGLCLIFKRTRQKTRGGRADSGGGAPGCEGGSKRFLIMKFVRTAPGEKAFKMREVENRIVRGQP